MKVLIAPDSFKESLPASAVAHAMAEGVRQVWPTAEIDCCPMADGGQGTVEAMVSATSGRMLSAETLGPLCEPLVAAYGLLGQGRVAVIEMAAAAGLELLPPEQRNPLKTTTFGVGKLILAALDQGVSEIILGIGGSATVDGGVGCAQALGAVFLDKTDKPFHCGMAGGDLGRIGRIDISDIEPRLGRVSLRTACDVTNPLCGPGGAAAVYGPQKGATPAMVAQLDAGLVNLAAVLRHDVVVDVETLVGSGAAGGLGAILVALAGARLERGLEIVAEAVGLGLRMADCQLVITGEGRLDGQSRSGKTAFGVAAAARVAGVKVICIPGQATTDAPLEHFDLVAPLVGKPALPEGEVIPLAQALADPVAALRTRTAQACRHWQGRCFSPKGAP